MRLNYTMHRASWVLLDDMVKKKTYTRISARAPIEANTYRTNGYLQLEPNPRPKDTVPPPKQKNARVIKIQASSQTPDPSKSPLFFYGLTLCISAQLERGGCEVYLRLTLLPRLPRKIPNVLAKTHQSWASPFVSPDANASRNRKQKRRIVQPPSHGMVIMLNSGHFKDSEHKRNRSWLDGDIPRWGVDDSLLQGRTK